jgi:hypothetical protein
MTEETSSTNLSVIRRLSFGKNKRKNWSQIPNWSGNQGKSMMPQWREANLNYNKSCQERK